LKNLIDNLIAIFVNKFIQEMYLTKCESFIDCGFITL